MIVICNKNTKRLIKGLKYEVSYLRNSPSISRGRIGIKGIGFFNVNNFTDLNGGPVQRIDIADRVEKSLSFSELKEGDLIVCKSNKYKTLIRDKIYKVEKLKTVTKENKRWDGSIVKFDTNSIMLEGSNRFLIFNSWSFRKPNPDEVREISLGSILDNEEMVFAVDKNTRKIDLVDNKKLELMKVISKSILDPNRHHLDVVDWACKISGIKLNRKDFDDILNMNLKDILDIK